MLRDADQPGAALRVLRADPSGNITLFVLDEVAPDAHAGIAQKLLAMPELGGEQVAFCRAPRAGCDGRIDMAGGEFCGNAARAFGMVLARGSAGLRRFTVEVSGCAQPVAVCADGCAGTASSRMPLPVAVRPAAVDGCAGTLVHLGGIVHFVTDGVQPSAAFFRRAEPMLAAAAGQTAYGVVFLEKTGGKLTPLVKVPAAASLFWEGSCGSGSFAAGVARSAALADGTFRASFANPRGVIDVELTRSGGHIRSGGISGAVTLDQEIRTVFL